MTTRKNLVIAGVSFALAASGVITAPADAEDTTFSSSAGLTVAGGSTDASPYPSAITVSGISDPITGVRVALNGFNFDTPVHSYAALVAPNGDALMLWAKIGTTSPTGSINLVFADSAASFATQSSLSSGTYKPSSYGSHTFAAPGPGSNAQKPGPQAGNTATFASVFGGDAANGSWKLYIHDDGGGGTLSRWSLTISTAHVPAPQAPDTVLTKTPAKKVKTAKKKAKVSFAFTSTPAGATFECSVDGKAFSPCTSGASFKAKIGKHTFAVRAVAAGVTDPTPATYAFKVKKKA